MSKDFSEHRRTWGKDARTFVLGGETFVAKENVRPEVIGEYEEKLAADERSLGDVIRSSDEALLQMLESEEDRDRYLALRAREENPVTLNEIAELVRWLFEEYTGRPTTPSPPSSNGVDGTGTSLTDTSSPRAVAAVQMG